MQERGKHVTHHAEMIVAGELPLHVAEISGQRSEPVGNRLANVPADQGRFLEKGAWILDHPKDAGLEGADGGRVPARGKSEKTPNIVPHCEVVAICTPSITTSTAPSARKSNGPLVPPSSRMTSPTAKRRSSESWRRSRISDISLPGKYLRRE
jgi:hypothetical protein